ncbi:MAG: catalase HPII, partial [Methylophilus sp.]|nr:catalase HPII [Methylophilus sp.]
NISEELASRVADGLGFKTIPNPYKSASAVEEMPPSPAVQLIGKMKDTLQGRSIGILISDGSDATTISTIKKAAIKAGASVKIVAPKIGEAKLNDGTLLKIDGQLAGTPSVIFDAIAIVLSSDSAKKLSTEAAAIDFIRDAFGHLKAIASDKGGDMLLNLANISVDAGVIDTTSIDTFITAAKTRQWDREKYVRATS